MWKADKSCKWFMSWCKTINNEETNVAKGREGFGTRTSKKRYIPFSWPSFFRDFLKVMLDMCSPQRGCFNLSFM